MHTLNILTILGTAVVAGATGAGSVILVNYVELQGSSPGIVQTGHSNITGYSLAGRFGANTSPTLARVQVLETGTMQGVRSESGSGVAIFGKSTASTGLGAGGYFTSSSVGGRGIVGDAISTTGNTVGGLFYSRSATGTAGTFFNINTGGRTDLAGPNGAVYVGTGTVTKNYGAGVRSAIPIAYGTVSPTGTIYNEGSANWTVSHGGTGVYYVTVTGENVSYSTYVCTASVTYGGEVSPFSTSNNLGLDVYDSAGNALDNYVAFVLYKNVPGALYPPTPRHGFKDDLQWGVHRPKEFAAYRAACKKAEQAASSAGEVQSVTPPQ